MPDINLTSYIIWASKVLQKIISSPSFSLLVSETCVNNLVPRARDCSGQQRPRVLTWRRPKGSLGTRLAREWLRAHPREERATAGGQGRKTQEGDLWRKREDPGNEFAYNRNQKTI